MNKPNIKVTLEDIQKADYIDVVRNNVSEYKTIKLKRNGSRSFVNEEGNRAAYFDKKIFEYIENGIWTVTLISLPNKQEEKEDLIKEPSHYHKNEIDVFGFLEKHFPKDGTYTVAEGFYIGCIIKYVCRYKNKNGLQDLEKAGRNLQKLMELEKQVMEGTGK